MTLRGRTDEIEELDLVNDTLNESDEAVLEEMDQQDDTTPALTSARTGFNYTDMPTSSMRDAEEIAERIRNRLQTAIIDIGKDLIAIKGKLGHGNFGRWLRFQFDMSPRTAENYMRVAREFGTAPKIVDLLPHGTVYRLAAPSTPDEVRQAVIDEIAAGTTPDQADVEMRIKDGKEAERQMKQEEREKKATERQKRAWQSKEKALRKTGASEADIEAERKNWETDKTQKDREKEQDRQAKKQHEEAAQRQHEEDKKQVLEVERKRADRVVRFLKQRLGAEFAKFRDAIEKVGIDNFERALKDA